MRADVLRRAVRLLGRAAPRPGAADPGRRRRQGSRALRAHMRSACDHITTRDARYFSEKYIFLLQCYRLDSVDVLN